MKANLDMNEPEATADFDPEATADFDPGKQSLPMSSTATNCHKFALTVAYIYRLI